MKINQNLIFYLEIFNSSVEHCPSGMVSFTHEMLLHDALVGGEAMTNLWQLYHFATTDLLCKGIDKSWMAFQHPFIERQSMCGQGIVTEKPEMQQIHMLHFGPFIRQE
ncbi:MAG: hypothetical protein Q8R88_01250 [Desulfoprunum sp.]|nr:hypothetical protein [Desulfoprunum sp.]